MITPEMCIATIKERLGKSGKTAFVSAVLIGLLTHMPALVSDIPNHDGLASMYFDQNMVTSGRWFLGIACGITSYFSIPWLIGVLAIIYLGVASVFLNKLLEVENPLFATLISGMLVTFPAIASNFAYVYTMDGYMLGVLFAILSVYFTKQWRLGFLPGALTLALSMGIYQSYLPIAILLCMYEVMLVLMNGEKTGKKISAILRYAYMGGIGVFAYYIILRICLLVQGKELDTYQGINGMVSSDKAGILSTVKAMVSDFITFTVKGNILFANGFALVACVVLALAFAAVFVYFAIRNKWFRKIWFYVFAIIFVAIVPLASNVILLISPDVNYHILMRYQWAFFGILALAFINRFLSEQVSITENKYKLHFIVSWLGIIAAMVIVFSYAISDNIAYSNLNKKYEKTYAYCLRLADRIEQTEGYYPGIPIYMIGVVGEDNFPVTDITDDVTGHMLGMNGDYLLYTGRNYELFYKYYMGITFNFLEPEEANFYYEDWYTDMPSFPLEGSVKVVDGILAVKTENSNRN